MKKKNSDIPDEIYYENLEREAWEAFHLEQIEKCNHVMPLVYISSRWSDGWKRYYATFHCSECDLWNETEIEQDDYLAYKNSGVEVR